MVARGDPAGKTVLGAVPARRPHWFKDVLAAEPQCGVCHSGGVCVCAWKEQMGTPGHGDESSLRPC